MLSGYAWYAIGFLTSAPDSVTSGTNVRVNLLPQTQMFPGSLHRIRVAIQFRKIVCDRGDIALIIERRMYGDDLHRSIDARSRAEDGQLLLQITLLLTSQVWD